MFKDKSSLYEEMGLAWFLIGRRRRVAIKSATVSLWRNESTDAS